MPELTCSHVSRRNALLGGADAAALGCVATSTTSALADTTDPSYPRFGDSRYRVLHYQIGDTILTGSSPRLFGSTTMTCVAARSMTNLFVDFQHTPNVVSINGKAVRFSRTSSVATTYGDQGGHRRFTVSGFSLPAGARFTLKVGYNVSADANRTASLLSAGAYFVVAGEPIAATHWFPCNDRLDVKSTYGVSISTQRANRVMLARPTSQTFYTSGRTAMTNIRFAVAEPSATYQLGLAVGPFSVTSGTWSIGGRDVPYGVAAQPGLTKSTLLDHTPRALSYFAARYGSFPFSHAGGVLVKDIGVGAQETVGGPTYDASCNTAAFVAHENAHMWFGNSVTAASWADVVLIQEGLAQLLEWDYVQMLRATSGTSAAMWAPLLTPPTTWRVPTHMKVEKLTYQYAGGLMRELRREMDGSIEQARAPRFTAFLRTLATGHAHSSITRAQFKAEAQKAAGKDLSGFLRRYGI